MKKIESISSKCCQVKRQEAMDTKYKISSEHKNTFLLWGQLKTGTVCLEFV